MSVITVVSGSEAAEVFKLVEAALDTIAMLIEIPAVFIRPFEIGAWGNNGLNAAPLQMTAQRFANVAFIGQQSFRFEAPDQGPGLGDIGGMSTGKPGTHRQPFFIGRHVDFGGQSSTGSPHSLIAPPPFPALDC